MNDVQAAQAAGAPPPRPVPEPAPAVRPHTLKQRALEALRGFTAARRHKHLELLQASRAALFDKLREIPERMQKLANQVRLLVELVDDYWAGRYREVSWYSLAVATLGALYFLSPNDVVPDFLPFLGQLDDVAVMAIALQFLKRDLRRYCEFRGLDTAAYF
jgi:uncharacterized membrane protein YkvA (DUF1232 family)